MLRVLLRYRSPFGLLPTASLRAIGAQTARTDRSFSRTGPSTWRAMNKSLAAAAAIIALSGVVSADTLAQPQTTALESRAANYIQFRDDVAAIEQTPIKQASATREAHKRLAAHDPLTLSSGWVAYAALVAAETPAFTEAMQKEVSPRKRHKGTRLKGRDGFLAMLSQDPSYPRTLKGADAAIERVLSMTAQDSSRFYALGDAFKTQAYAIQKTKWGKQRLTSGTKRNSEASQFASGRPEAIAPDLGATTKKGVTMPTLAGAEASWSADWGATGATGRMSEANAQVIMDRVLNLAARYSAGGMNEKIVDVYSKNNKSQKCLSMAKLTLAQCIAATRTPYEEAFCLGEHGLNDVGACVGWVASADAS